jgi:hypothetical protein
MVRAGIDGQAVVTIRVDEGAPGVDMDGDNPVARAARKSLETGSGASARVVPVLFRDPLDQALRWFGVFVQSEADRVVFFPGLADKYDRVRGERDDGAGKFDQMLNVDHLTLEPDFKTWHVTPRGDSKRAKRQSAGRTMPLGEGRLLWFGMTIAKPSFLRLVKMETDVWAPLPGSLAEGGRRLREFIAALEKSSRPILATHGPPPFPMSLLHFCVVIGRRGAPPYRGIELALPESWDGVLTALPRVGAIPVAPGIVPLSDEVQLEFFVAWIPGHMNPDVVYFTSKAPSQGPTEAP